MSVKNVDVLWKGPTCLSKDRLKLHPICEARLLTGILRSVYDLADNLHEEAEELGIDEVAVATCEVECAGNTAIGVHSGNGAGYTAHNCGMRLAGMLLRLDRDTVNFGHPEDQTQTDGLTVNQVVAD